jgi:hypothetical protein
MAISEDILFAGLADPREPISSISLPELVWQGNIRAPKEDDENQRYRIVGTSVKKPERLAEEPGLLIAVGGRKIPIVPIAQRVTPS